MAQQIPPPPPYAVPPQRSRGPLVLVGVLVLILIALLGVGGVLLFKRLDKPDSVTATKPSTPDAVEFRRVLKAEPGQCPSPATDTVICDANGTRYTLGKIELNGSQVIEVKAAQSTDNLGWHVNLTLGDAGARTFETLTLDLSTKQPPQNQLAIVVRGQVVAAPAVQSAIAGGQVQISGNYTKQTAEDLAKQITG